MFRKWTKGNTINFAGYKGPKPEYVNQYTAINIYISDVEHEEISEKRKTPVPCSLLTGVSVSPTLDRVMFVPSPSLQASLGSLPIMLFEPKNDKGEIMLKANVPVGQVDELKGQLLGRLYLLD